MKRERRNGRGRSAGCADDPREACEEKHFPIEASDPIEAIQFRVEQEVWTIAR
jgi:antitoxin component HigA of HigAB toxin-antitoxin module